MNKIISKIVGVTLGLALAASSGVVAFSSLKRNESGVRQVEAADDVVAEAKFNSTNNQTSVSGYTSTWENITDSFSWTVANFNNNSNGWSYVKCGRKNYASVASISTTNAVSDAITKVSITIDALTASKINSITLYGGTDATTSLGTFTAATGTQTVTIDSPTANHKYKVEFDCASGSGNGLLTLSKVILYKEATGTIDSVVVKGPSSETETVSVTSGLLGLKTVQLSAEVSCTEGLSETVTWSSSNTGVATVDSNGSVRLLADGSSVITATSTVDTTVSGSITVSSSGLTAYTGSTDTGDFTDTTTWGTTTISEFSGTLTNISFADGGSTSNKLAYNKDGNMRVYSGTKMTLTCSSAYAIEYVVATSESGNPFTVAPTSSEATCGLYGLEWLVDATASSAQSVTLSYSGNTAYIDTLSVYYVSTGSCGIAIDNSVSSLTRGDSGTFTATASNATNPSISWSSSNSSVISIDSSTGEYSAAFVGEATITASLTCDEGSDSASFDVKVAGSVSIAEANTICAALESGSQTSYKVTLENYIIDLNPNGKDSGSENQLTLADYKVGGSGNSFLIYGVTSSYKVSGKLFRAQAVLNGTLKVSGYLKNYSGTYEMVSPTLNSYSDDAMSYAASSYAALATACETGPDAVTDEQWEALATAWSSLDAYSKAKLQAATSSYEYNTDIANWIDRYTRIVQAGRTDFMELDVGSGSRAFVTLSTDSTVLLSIITITAILGVTTIGGYFFLRKKKEQ